MLYAGIKVSTSDKGQTGARRSTRPSQSLHEPYRHVQYLVTSSSVRLQEYRQHPTRHPGLKEKQR